jgi:nitronate monooxygenase
VSAAAALARADAFATRLGLAHPVWMAPMAGVHAVPLAAAVASTGGLAALGALLFDAEGIASWVQRWRAEAGAAAPLNINLWVPDPAPVRNPAHEAQVRAFLAQHGPAVPPEAGDAPLHSFGQQCEALLAARPRVVSSVMGLFPPAFVARARAAGLLWAAHVSTVAEAREAEAAGADILVAQGSEAGGHRGTRDAASARDRAVGLFALLPQVVDAVKLPVVATGGIADARGVAAALLLGASAVQVGTALLRCPEAGIHPAWVAALGTLAPEDTQLTRAFSGRWGRAIATRYVRDAASAGAPEPAPYPVQRGLTAPMRKAAEAAGDLQHLQAWAGQAAALGTAAPAADVVRGLWAGAQALLR